MNINEICSPDFYRSEKPYVASIWTGLHQKLFEAEGKEFTFEIPVKSYDNDFQWHPGLFSAGKWSCVRFRESDGDWKQAYEALALYRHFLPEHSTEEIIDYDSRPEKPKAGTLATVRSHMVIKVPVSENVSTALYNMYRREGESFRDRVRSHGLQLWRVYPMDLQISMKSKQENGWQMHVDGFVEAGQITYSQRPYNLKFSDLGMAELSTHQQCYGMLLAMVEEAMPVMERLGDVRLQVWGTVAGWGKAAIPAMGYRLYITPREQKLNQW